MSSEHISLLAVTIPLAGVVGLFVGSFLNVVIYRTPLGLSVAAPRSFCPTCDRQLMWWENVPVISWVALRGRCRTCHLPISVRYPLVELSTAVAFALTTWAWHGTVIAAAYCVLVASLIAVALIEYGGQRAPLSVAAVGTGIALIIIVIGGGWQHRWTTLAGSLVGTVLATAVYALLRSQDPDALDPRGYGRSSLLLAGCWAGGLGLRAAATGTSCWIAAYFLCMVAAWASTRQSVTMGDSTPTLARSVNPVFGVPLITAITLGMAASLIAGA
jgi:prepilin signal peptidase PulO-like enzyme (type II secretory pathway)